MANSCLLLMALLFVSFASLGRSQVDILGVNITGRVFCSPTGNPSANSQPLVNATVSLVCNGQTVGQALTNTTGIFTILPSLNSIAPFINPLPLSLPSCKGEVNLPVDVCSLLPQAGSIRAPILVLDLVNSVLTLILGLFSFE